MHCKVLPLLLSVVLYSSLAAQGEQLPVDDTSARGAEPRIRPGDQVALRIDREPEMSGVFTVSENGEVVLPRLGSVRVGDRDPAELQDALRTDFAKYLRNPAIEVTVLRRVAVSGEVRKPDLYMVDLTLTLRDVIAKAGGFTEEANSDKVVLVRGEERRTVAEEDFSLPAAELRSGDQIVVARKSRFAQNPFGEVGTVLGVVSGAIVLILGIANLAK